MVTLDKINKLLQNYKDLQIGGKQPYKSRLKNLGDFHQLPILDKRKLSELNSHNKKCVKNSVLVHVTSGSTEKPLIMHYSRESLNAIVKRIVLSYKLARVKKGDVVLDSFAYGTFVAGPIYDLAARKMELTLLPFGSPNMTDRDTLLRILKFIPIDVICAVPSYAFEIVTLLEEQGIALPKKILCAGEPLIDKCREELKSKKVTIFNNYGCTEVPAISAESIDGGGWMTLLEEGLYVELVDELGNTLIEGEGDLVITDLLNYSTPIVRYKTGDRVQLKIRNEKKYIKVLGREDNLTKFRGYLLNLDLLISFIKEYSINFLIVLSRDKNTFKDKMELHLPSSLSHKKEELSERLHNKFKIKPDLIFEEKVLEHRTLSGKLNHIIDHRRHSE